MAGTRTKRETVDVALRELVAQSATGVNWATSPDPKTRPAGGDRRRYECLDRRLERDRLGKGHGVRRADR
ncbi:MAG: hypothetical protein ACYDEP_11500 [Acidimicrobiales bacterium]